MLKKLFTRKNKSDVERDLEKMEEYLAQKIKECEYFNNKIKEQEEIISQKNLYIEEQRKDIDLQKIKNKDLEKNIQKIKEEKDSIERFLKTKDEECESLRRQNNKLVINKNEILKKEEDINEKIYIYSCSKIKQFTKTIIKEINSIKGNLSKSKVESVIEKIKNQYTINSENEEEN